MPGLLNFLPTCFWTQFRLAGVLSGQLRVEWRRGPEEALGKA